MFVASIEVCVGSSGMSMPDFDNQTLAALRGRMVRYLMRSREVRLTTGDMLTWHQRANSIIFVVHIDYTGKSNQGQTYRYRSVIGGTGVENIKKTR